MSDVAAAEERPVQATKDLYEVGEIPPMGHVPKQMYAWAIRRERQGEPNQAMQVEVVDTPVLDSHEVLVLVMAAGAVTATAGVYHRQVRAAIKALQVRV